MCKGCARVAAYKCSGAWSGMKGEKGKRARDKARKEVLKAGEVKAKQTIPEVLCGLERERNARGTREERERNEG